LHGAAGVGYCPNMTDPAEFKSEAAAAADGEGKGPRRRDNAFRRRSEIARAAIDVVALHGVAGLTHRLVARQAGCSLAATTYYFDSKFDIVREASQLTLEGYADSLRRTLEHAQKNRADPSFYGAFVARLVRNAVGRDRSRAICWAEMLLDASRHEETLLLSQQWNASVRSLWLDIAIAVGVKEPAEAARSAIDVTVGLVLVASALGVPPHKVDAVLLGGADPMAAWAPPPASPDEDGPFRKSGKKAAQTREKIIQAAIAILVTDGAEALTYRMVAERAGIARAGPFYHFPTINGLLAAAQARLFEESKQRYREAASERPEVLDNDRLIDRTVAVLVREATEFSASNLATYAIWLQASRQPDLRPMVWRAIVDQYRAWDRLLSSLSQRTRPADAMIAFSLFVGIHLRVLTTGSTIESLSHVRSELAWDFGALLNGRYPL